MPCRCVRACVRARACAPMRVACVLAIHSTRTLRLRYSYYMLQVEINPFGLTPQKQVVSFDAKIQFDDNAEFRQKKLFEMDDKAEKVCNVV